MCEDIAFPLLPNQAVADFRYRFKIAIMRVAAVGTCMANIACRACWNQYITYLLVRLCATTVC